MTTLAALTTPCLLLEDEKLQANMDRLARRLHERGVSLRPHLKTCKNIEIARRCMESPSGPATVSTLAEAEYFAAGDVRTTPLRQVVTAVSDGALAAEAAASFLSSC